MAASDGRPAGAAFGRFLALGLNGLAVLWVIAAALSIVVDHTQTAELVVIAIQATVALGIQAYVIWRIATGWLRLSTAGKVGMTVLGVVVAPIELALGIVGAAVAAAIWIVVAVLRSGAGRSATASNRAGRSPSGTAASRAATATRRDGRAARTPQSRTGLR